MGERAIVRLSGYEKSKTWGRYGTWLVWPFVVLVGVLPVPFALVLATGGSLWSLTLQTLTVAAVLIGLILALLFLGGLAETLPKAATATNLRRLVATLADAVEPGATIQPHSDADRKVGRACLAGSSGA